MNQLTPEQQRLAKALQSFPDKITEETLDWPEGYKLYEALRNLPQEVLNVSGRFLYSDISTLKGGKYYLLGHNPAGNPAHYPVCLRDEIRQWFARNDNAYDERWESNPKGQAPLQDHVKVLLSAIGANLNDVCASNIFFVRSQKAKDLVIYNDFSVHKAVLDIVKPDCIIAFHNTGGSSTYNLLLHEYMTKLKQVGQPIFIGKDGSFDQHLTIAEGQYWNKTLKVIGLPHLSYFDPSKYQDVLQKIAEECRNATAKP